MSNLPTTPNPTEGGYRAHHDTGFRSWPMSTWVFGIISLVGGLYALRNEYRVDKTNEKAAVAKTVAETNTANLRTVAETSAKMAEAPKGSWPTTADARELKQIAADPSQVPPSAK